MLDRTLQPVYAVSTPSVRHVATRYAALVTVRRAALSALMAATLAVRPTALNAQAPAPAANPPGTIKFVKGRILVGPKAGLSTAELDKILAVHGARRVKHMPEINVHVIELPAQANEMAAIKALQANPHIKFAELDYLLDPSPGVNDPSFSSE